MSEGFSQNQGNTGGHGRCERIGEMLNVEYPLLAEEGWLRHQLKAAKPPKAPQTGAKRERDSAKP